MDILAGPAHSALSDDQRPFVTLEGLLKILAFAQNAFDFVGLGFVNAAEGSRGLAMADAFPLVAAPSALALGMLERSLSAPESAGLDALRFQMVLNLCRRNDTDFVARRVAILEQTIAARLPNDSRQANGPLTFATPLAASPNNVLL